jgi:predicted ester cyclase
VTASIGDLVERFYGQLWNNWNDSAVEDMLSPGFTFRGSLGQQTLGPDGWRSYRDLVRAGSADFHNEIIELVCDGQRAAARLRYTGTHTGALLGLPATHRRFEYAGAAFSPPIPDGSPAPGSLAFLTRCAASSVRSITSEGNQPAHRAVMVR